MKVPHAFPFQMLDRVVATGTGDCTVVRLLCAAEAVTEGRVGPRGLYPAALLFEALIQAAAPLASAAGRGAGSGATRHRGRAIRRRGRAATGRDRAGGGPPGLLLAIRDARVLQPVRFGDRLRITATVTARFAGMVRVSSTAVRDGDRDGAGPVATGEFTLGLEGS